MSVEELKRLHEILADASFRLEVGKLIADPNVQQVNCLFCCVAVYRDKAEQYRDELITLLNSLHLRSLEECASYVNLGFDIQSSDLVFNLFGVGHVLKLWRVVTTADKSLPEDVQQQLFQKQSPVSIVEVDFL